MGVNDSKIHVDFMIGTKDLSIVGTTKEGKQVQIFKDGNWAFLLALVINPLFQSSRRNING